MKKNARIGNGRPPRCLKLSHRMITMRSLSLPGVLVSIIMVAWTSGQPRQMPERTARPFSFFAPVVELRADDLERIRGGRAVTDTIDSSGHELAVFAAGSLQTTPEAFIARVTDIVRLRKSRLVPAIARFSTPPTLDDLAELTLSEQDLKQLSECRPGDCGLKLGDAEMHRMQAALARAGSDRRSTAERAFREILLERVQTYLARGLAALPAYHDQSRPVDAGQAFGRLVDRSVYLHRVPLLTASLGGGAAERAAASYVYWSIEDFGRKPVIRVTHVAIVRPDAAGLPDVLVGSTQVYASHYTDAALAITTFERGAGETALLGYLYRARVDVLGNFLVRRLVERRVEDEVERLFIHQLGRLQGGG